MFGVVLTS